MGSLTRKLAKVTVALEQFLFGRTVPPNQECSIERGRLASELRACALAFGEPSPTAALRYLRKMQHEYNADTNGPSRWMSLLDNIDALRAVEAEIRKEAQHGNDIRSSS